MASIHIHLSHKACIACHHIYIQYIQRTCTMDAQIGLIMDFSLCLLQKGSLLPSSWPAHLNTSRLHVTARVKKIYKEPLAYQGKILYILILCY